MYVCMYGMFVFVGQRTGASAHLASDVEADGVHSSDGDLDHVGQQRHARGRGRGRRARSETELPGVAVAERGHRALCRDHAVGTLSVARR